MKKSLTLIAVAIVALGMYFTSCDGAPSTKVSVKTDIDTLSYAYGAALYEQGLSMHLQQMGLVVDTAMVSGSYIGRISAEADPVKKAELGKEMRTKIDSVTRANGNNVAQFLKGFKEGLTATKADQGYNAGFGVGTQIAEQMLPQLLQQMYGADSEGKTINKSALVAAVGASMKNEALIVPHASMYFEQKMQQIQESLLMEQYGANKAAGEKFLADNKSKAGVISLPSGVQYKVLSEGKGAKPTDTDQVKCHYHGTLIDGSVFDSSVDRGEAATFGVRGVIEGWTEVLKLMPVGSKWEVYIPQDKAYGAMDRGEIKPFSALVFQIELLSIETGK